MPTQRTQPAEFLPVLSRGKHRRPRHGACLMEYTSFLAGERWSDHPACTHPLIAELARQVNDFVSDASRQRLADLVPDLIGLTGDDLRIDVRVSLRAARAAVPVVADELQRVMAVAIVGCERLNAELGGYPGAPLSDESTAALASVPRTAEWADRFAQGLSISRRTFRRQTAPSIVRYAVQGIARACIPDPDAVLHDVLVGAIADGKALSIRQPTEAAPASAPTGSEQVRAPFSG